mgnify:CR=1 FL=1
MGEIQDVTGEEVEQLVMALARKRAGKPFSEAEAALIVNWVHAARFDMALSQMVLGGEIEVDVVDGSLMFSLPLEDTDDSGEPCVIALA